MDLRQHFYRFVYNLVPYSGHERILRSVNFQDLFSWEYDTYLKQPLWGLSRNDRKTLTSLVALYHIQHWSWVLALPNVVDIEQPFLLTTNPRIRRVYYGPASVTSADYDFADAEDSHVPLALASHRWLGVLHNTLDGLMLEAFAEVDFQFDTTHRAFCPEWDDGLDDDDVWLFEVTVPAS